MNRITTLLVALLAVTSLVAAPIAAGMDVQDTDLAIEVAGEAPNHLNEQVQETTDNDTRIYEVPHDELRLQPQDFESSQVVSYGVEEDVATLTHDDDFDEYHLDTDGHEGTFTVYWEIEVDREVEVENDTADGNESAEGNETTTETEVQTVRERYTAVIRVTEADDYETFAAGALDETREAAGNWNDLADEVEEIAGEGVDVEAQLYGIGLTAIELRHDPLSALTGSYTMILMMIVLSLGGGLFGLQLIGMHYGIRLSDILYRRRVESERKQEAEIDERATELKKEELKRALANVNWQDVGDIGDRMARAFRDSCGNNALTGSLRLAEVLGAENIIHDRLLAMGQNGYVAVVEREAARTDGGDEDEPPAIVDASLHRADEIDDQRVADTPELEVDDLSSPSDELVRAVDWNAPEMKEFDLAEVSLDYSEMDTRLEGLDFEELMAQMNADRQDFENPRVFGQYIKEIFEHVRKHPFTDEDGAIDKERYVLNHLLQVANFQADIFQFPVFDFAAEAIERQLIEDNPVEEADETMQRIKEGSA